MSKKNKQNISFWALIIFTVVNVYSQEEYNSYLLDSIQELYDGKITLSKGIALEQKESNNYLEIKIEDSNTMDDYEGIKYLPASNIALTSYLISENYCKSYSIYRVLLQDNQSFKKYEYSNEKLSEVSIYLGLIYDFIDLLKKRNYKKLESKILVNSHFDFNKQHLINGLKKVDPDYGNIKNSIITGFTYNNMKEGFTFIKVYGFFERTKKNNYFSFYINPSDNSVFLIEYKW